MQRHEKLQLKWTERWESAKCFHAPEQPRLPKYYTRDAAPFPNGNLHIGHLRNYVLGDIMARYKRQCGYDVLYTTNFDAFGLPNELAAQELGIEPKALTDRNIEEMLTTFRTLGISYDFARIRNTSDPNFFRWTQWLFLKMLDTGLVYRGEKDLPWCSSCEISLAFLQIVDGRCWRCGEPVGSRRMPQWFIRMASATKLLLERLDQLPHWSERSKQLLRGFIGQAEGWNIRLQLANKGLVGHSLQVFVPAHHDLKKIEFLVAAPTGDALQNLISIAPPRSGALKPQEYANNVARFTTMLSPKGIRRKKGSGESGRLGFDTGLRVFSPDGQFVLSIWAVNYLSTDAGPTLRSCAPACDTSDQILARRYDISKSLPRGASAPPRAPSADIKPARHYRIRDWAISRGKKWGTPMPIIHCDRCGYLPVSPENLPVLHEDPIVTSCPSCRGEAARESDTIDCNFDDSWCFILCSAERPEDNPFTDNPLSEWLPVDWYNSGFDVHTQAHVHRFISWFLHEKGLSKHRELIDGYHGHDLVLGEFGKISKRYAHEGDLSELIKTYGSDVLRVAIAWAANPGKQIRWRLELITAARKLLDRFYSTVTKLGEQTATTGQLNDRGASISTQKREKFSTSLEIDVERVARFIAEYRPNAAIRLIDRRLSIFSRLLSKITQDQSLDPESMAFAQKSARTITQLLSPFAPFHCEEAWELLGGDGLVSTALWPNAARPAACHTKHRAGEREHSGSAGAKHQKRLRRDRQ